MNALRIPIGHGITGGVAKSMQPDLIEDTRGVERYIHDLMSPGSEACVPIVHGNELLGVLDSEHPDIGWFDEQDVETLSAIAALTSAQWVQCETIKQLKQAEKKADAANSAKQDFLANISHEIRTPLNGISGCLEILSEDLQNPVHLSTLGLAQRATSDLTALIDQALEFSLIEAGKIKLNSIDCDLASLIDDCRGMFESKAQSEKLELIIEGFVENGRVHTDFLRVKQVLYNLVHNAIKFTDEGSVSVSINRAAKGNLIMKVSDTGVGMDEATQERVFNRFIIADASRSRRHGGAGLGLAISRRLVDKLGGVITVSSSLGQGTTFSVEIPMEDCPRASQTVSNIPKNIPDCSGMQILLAEDSDTNAYIARHFIEKCKAYVTHVKNGKQAVEIASKVNFDLVLMDVSMPEMDGLQASRIIKEASNTKDVPIVALSAHVAADDLASCYEAGMCDFLSKPINKAALYEVLAHFSNLKSV